MADPKYAGLPGIAYDQPDCFETSDLPEADQEYILEDCDPSDSVERLHISAIESFNKFKGKFLDGSKADFSGKISQRPNVGYDARHGDWELVREGDTETVRQKFNRLKFEITELGNELSQVEDIPSQDSAALCSQVEALQRHLLEMRTQDVAGSHASLELLLSHMESKPVPKAQNKGGDGVKYELFFRPQQAQLSQGSRIADLEKRLEKMEAVLGATPNRMSSLSAETGHKSLLGAIAVLDSKASLLEPTHLDHIEGRLSALSQKMSQVATHPGSITSEEKLSTIFETCRRAEGLCAALPHVIERMTALQGLHQQALEFSHNLSQIDATQQQLQSDEHSLQRLLQETRESVKTDVQALAYNMQQIDQRIKTVNK